MRGPHALAACALALLALTSCSLVQTSSEQSRRQQALQQQRAAAQQRCRQRNQQLQPLLARFRDQRRQLLAIEHEAYSPGAGQPRPLDPEEQRRLAPYDQEIEEDQHRQAMEAWQQQERERRWAWRQAQAVRLQQARGRFDQAAAALSGLAPRVVDASAPMGLNPTVLSALKRCDEGP